MKRGDLIEVEDRKYIVVQMGWHDNEPERLMAWDFKAWSEDYYDAYLPFDMTDEEAENNGYYYPAIKSDECVELGNIYESPELLPIECDGYNGEPNIVKVATIWENPAFSK